MNLEFEVIELNGLVNVFCNKFKVASFNPGDNKIKEENYILRVLEQSPEKIAKVFQKTITEFPKIKKHILEKGESVLLSNSTLLNKKFYYHSQEHVFYGFDQSGRQVAFGLNDIDYLHTKDTVKIAHDYLDVLDNYQKSLSSEYLDVTSDIKIYLDEIEIFLSENKLAKQISTYQIPYIDEDRTKTFLSESQIEEFYKRIKDTNSILLYQKEEDLNMNMQVTVTKYEKEDSNLKGFASVVIGNVFKLGGISIVENPESKLLYVNYPAYKTSKKDDEGKDIYKYFCNPITKEMREEINAAIISKYHSKNEEKEIDQTIVNPNYKIHVNPLNKENSSVVALANVVFESSVAVNGIKVVAGKNGLFVSMPNKLQKKGEEEVFNDICHPITKEFREQLYNDILNEYQKSIEKEQEQKIDQGMQR